MDGHALAPIAPALPAEIADRLAKHAHHARGAMAAETERALRKASAAFTAWCSRHGAPALPASAETLARSVDALAEAGRKPAGIRQAVWAVAAMHRAAGLADPSKAEPVKLALKRMARALGTRQRQAAPLDELEVQRVRRWKEVAGLWPAV